MNKVITTVYSYGKVIIICVVFIVTYTISVVTFFDNRIAKATEGVIRDDVMTMLVKRLDRIEDKLDRIYERDSKR